MSICWEAQRPGLLPAAFEKLKMEAEKEDTVKTNLWNEVTSPEPPFTGTI